MDYDEEQENNKRVFYEMLSKVDPELYMIKMYLDQFPEVPAVIIPKYIRALGNILMGEGYGNVQTFVSKRIVTQIKGQETTLVTDTEKGY